MVAQREPYELPAIRAFAAELEAWRSDVGLSKTDLAETLGYTPQLIGQFEAGKNIPSERFAEDADTYFKTNGVFVRHWKWINDTRHVAVLPPGFQDFVKREAEASVLHIFDPSLVTGLFQTEAYAYQLLRPGRSAEEADQLVASRLKRQEILHGDHPPVIVWVCDEEVLRRLECHPAIAEEQLRRLQKIAQEPNVTLQIVPRRSGLYAGLPGSFTVLGFDDRPATTYMEGASGGYLFDRPAVVRESAIRFDLIRGHALPVDESQNLIESLLERL